MKKIITLCASASHYKELIQIEKKLKQLGFKVLVPDTLKIMVKNNDFRLETYKTWFKDKKYYSIKTKLIKNHFEKIIKSDAILIANFEKNGLEGYIGGNVLMEMAIAFHFKKPIFIYNQISKKLSIKEEIYGLSVKFIDQDLKQIKFSS